ncbi:MAG TPA: ABC transporter ATP-binding protein [Coriobacteriia bacterium]|nr:ABC transporter ATP-binding protein [Coriobacteriia bacterium]
MLEFDGVCFSYGRKSDEAGFVCDLNFSIDKGEYVAIIGGNGAGKTTTSKLINGLLKPSEGRVTVDGLTTTDHAVSKLAKKVGMLFQDPDRQICKNTVREELAFGLEIRGLAADEIKSRVDEVVSDFGFAPGASPFTLSRGERQMLALASVVICDPEILVLDEPTTGLDYRECMHIMERTRVLNEKGTTVIMICHDMEVVLDFAERIIVMAQGRIIADGDSAGIFRDEDVMRKASVLPPMMIDLSLRLSERADLKDRFGGFSSVDELLEILAKSTSARARS